MPDQTYTIDLPGFSDFIRIPALEDYEDKARRIERMKTHVSPVPDFLQWIPEVITWIDDAQDLLFTGLSLGKPLLKKLPARFIPGLGWVLLANDVANLGTAFLGTALGGTGLKPTWYKMVDVITGGRARRYIDQAGIRSKRPPSLSLQATSRIIRARDFLSSSQWLGFAIQAPQALESLTGYGLQLGTLMGAINDTTWGAVRKLDGDQVEFRLPPSPDPLVKAADFLIETAGTVFAGQILSSEDHLLLLAAASVATTIIAEDRRTLLHEERWPLLADTQIPLRRPWHPTTRLALAAAGINPEGAIRPFVPLDNPRPTFLQAAQLGSAASLRFQEDMRREFGPTSRGTVAQLLHDGAGLALWDLVHGIDGSTTPVYSDFDIFIAHAIEFNVFPARHLTPDELVGWYRLTWELTHIRGLNAPRKIDLQQAAEETLGGWLQRPIGWT